jgi:hypothetical protein
MLLPMLFLEPALRPTRPPNSAISTFRDAGRLAGEAARYLGWSVVDPEIKNRGLVGLVSVLG